MTPLHRRGSNCRKNIGSGVLGVCQGCVRVCQVCVRGKFGGVIGVCYGCVRGVLGVY